MTDKLPVLLIAFNRFDYTRRVISVLQNYQPAALYLAMDAPNNLEDESIQARISEHVLDCFPRSKVIFIRGESNLGTGIFIPQAITQFFEDEEFGVILEDDCVPTLTFFEYCRQLNMQRENFPQIMAICGSNLIAEGENGDAFQLGPFFVPWGWATWRDKWSKFERKQGVLSQIENELGHKWYTSDNLRSLMGKYIENSTSQESRVWTGYWLCSIIRADGFIATPDTNLVTNIGFQNSGINASRKLQGIFTLDSFEVENPIFHESTTGNPLTLENKYFALLNLASDQSTNLILKKVNKYLNWLRRELPFRLNSVQK